MFKSARIVLDGPSPAFTTTQDDAVLKLPAHVKLTPGSAAVFAGMTCNAERRGELFMEQQQPSGGGVEDVLHVCAWDGSAYRFRVVVFGSG